MKERHYFANLNYLTEPSAALLHPSGHKFHEVFQSRQGRYSDLPAAKISEMMKSNSLDVRSYFLFKKTLNDVADFKFCLQYFKTCTGFLQNAPTQSLLSVVNGILDESIERQNAAIPQVCA